MARYHSTLTARWVAPTIERVAVRFQNGRLLAARVELGLTQEQAAQVAGVDVRTYRRYESGEVNGAGDFTVNRASRRKIVHRLACELGIDERELLGEDIASAPGRNAESLARAEHVLPRARHFVGRAALLERLRSWAANDASDEPVLAVVAGGGAGKTSLLERASGAIEKAVFVWSFYEDAHVDAFFDSLIGRLGGVGAVARGELLDRATAATKSHSGVTLVLDGMEALQANADSGRAEGELLDPRMRLFLRQLTRGLGRARAVISSRLPLADLAGWEGTGLTTIALEPLSAAESMELLRRWGVRGSPLVLAGAVPAVGGHALSIAMVGSYVGSILGGDLARAEGIDLAAAQKDDIQARRLHELLQSFGAGLSTFDRDVLRRVCAFSRGVSRAALDRMRRAPAGVAGALAGHSAIELTAAIARLARAGLTFSEPASGRLSAHPFVRRHFRAELGETLCLIHQVERAHLLSELHALAGGTLEDAPLDTLESLLEHTLQAGDAKAAFALYRSAMGGFGRLGLALGELSRGLRVVRGFSREAGGDVQTLDEALPASMRMRLAYDWGLYAAALGDLPAALVCYEFDATLARDAGAIEMQATALRTLAYTCRLRGELDRARVAVALSIALCREHSLRESELRGIALRAAIASDAGQLAEASAGFSEARKRGDLPMARRALWEAEHLIRCGEIDRARALTEANLTACMELEWRGHAAHCETLLGSLDVADGALDQGAARLQRAEAWCKLSGEVEMTLRAADLERALYEKQRRSGEEVVARGRELALIGGFAMFPAFS